MERRNFFKTSAAGLIGSPLLFSDFAAAADKKNELNSKLELALSKCMMTGYACVSHCMKELADGNKGMAECNSTVHDMLASCEALLKLSSYKSPLAKQMMKICAEACDRCADACVKHKDHWSHDMHLPCRACYDACQECAKLCKA